MTMLQVIDRDIAGELAAAHLMTQFNGTMWTEKMYNQESKFCSFGKYNPDMELENKNHF